MTIIFRLATTEYRIHTLLAGPIDTKPPAIRWAVGMSECAAARELALAGKAVFLDHRLTVVIGIICVFNAAIQLITPLVKAHPAYEHVDEETKAATPVRLVQSLIGPLQLLAFPVLIYEAASGCDVSELFIYWGASWVSTFDLYDFIRRWPLRPTLAAHHIVTVSVGVALLDWRLWPANGHSFHRAFVAFFGCLGVQWITDAFSTVFRFSLSLGTIRRWRYAYLASGFARLAGAVLLLVWGIHGVMVGASGAATVSLILCVAYSFEQLRSVLWVYNFDARRFYDKHQATWVGAGVRPSGSSRSKTGPEQHA